MSTYNFHIHLPDELDTRETKENPFGIDVNALARTISELRQTNSKLREEIYKQAGDAPPDGFVTTKQYDGLVEMHRHELAELEAKHRKAYNTSGNTHIDTLKRKNERIIELEDKVAGYELGMSKEQVDKECKKPDADTHTKKGAKRRYNKQLTDKQIWTARAMHKKGGFTAADIAEVLGCGTNAAYRAARCITYAHVGNPPDKFKPITLRAGHGVVTNDKENSHDAG